MKVRFTPAAQADLAGIRQWIARENPARALSFVRELRSRALALSDFPRRHQIAAHSSSGSVRKLTHGRYLIYYRVLPDRVEIIQVRHSAMDKPQFD